MSKNEQDRQAAKFSTDPASLLSLATHPHWAVRLECVHNLHTPGEGVQALSKDDNSYVRVGAALHPNASADTLRELSDDVEAPVRQAVALREDVHSDILDALARDPSDKIRRTVAQNSQTPISVLESLRTDSDTIVQIYAGSATTSRS